MYIHLTWTNFLIFCFAQYYSVLFTIHSTHDLAHNVVTCVTGLQFAILPASKIVKKKSFSGIDAYQHIVYIRKFGIWKKIHP